MLELVNYGNFRELLKECKRAGLNLVSINNINNNDDYECDECKVILNNDYVKVTILIAIHDENELGLPDCIQVLNISMEPII